MLASRRSSAVACMLQQAVYILILDLSAYLPASLLMCREVVLIQHDSQERMSCCGFGGSSSRHGREECGSAALSILRVFEEAQTAEPVDSMLDAFGAIWSSCASVHDPQSQAW